MRKISESRKTKETDISLSLNLDGSGISNLKANLPFLEHMLDQTTRYSSIDLDLDAKGDLEIDAHHTVEDIGITLGSAFDKALGDKKGIQRFGYAYIPLDESLSRVVVDFSGRPGLHMKVDFVKEEIENSKRIFKSATPKYTVVWYVKWIASAFVLSAMAIRGIPEFTFLDLGLSLIHI